MRRALVVGINDYPQSPLRGCVEDATAFESLLERHGSGSPNFARHAWSHRHRRNVTRSTLRSLIVELFETDCDIALLYFSGHGFVRSGDGYIVTTDAENYDEGISMTEILGNANNSPARNRVIIFDCCLLRQHGHT